MKKNKLKNDTMNESQLQRVYDCPIYPKDSKIYSDKASLILITEAWEEATGLVFL